MQFQDLLQATAARVVAGDPHTAVTDLTDDSRRAGPGTLFVARSGTREHGREHVADALRRGAAAILCDTPPPSTAVNSAWAVAPSVDAATARALADAFFDAPARKLRLAGVTGTNGKTTTCFLLQHLLAFSGLKTGLVSTVLCDDGRVRSPAMLTTPGPIDMARLLAAMVDAGCRGAVIEVSSHALDQGRCDALAFGAAIFTNLSGDHLDYHGDMDRYAAAKARLFGLLSADGTAVVNADDPRHRDMLAATPAAALRCRLAETRGDAQCAARIVSMDSGGTQARFEGPWGVFEIAVPLAGRHNVMNGLEAAAAAWALGVTAPDVLARALTSSPAVPGRLEPIRTGADGDPTVLVDYAHTDDALENALRAVRPLTAGGVTVVFGCGGDRDATKRPRMARVACRLADRIVVTSDNPRHEEPASIIRDILDGVPAARRSSVLEEPDRRAAIFTAIREAGDRDLVLIAGKGHEDYQVVGDRRSAFDDRTVAREALRARSR